MLIVMLEHVKLIDEFKYWDILTNVYLSIEFTDEMMLRVRFVRVK